MRQLDRNKELVKNWLENKLVNDKEQQITRETCIPVRAGYLGFHKLDLLYAFSSVEGVRICASSMYKNTSTSGIGFNT